MHVSLHCVEEGSFLQKEAEPYSLAGLDGLCDVMGFL